MNSINVEDTKSIYTNQLHFSALTMNYLKRKLAEKNPTYNIIKKNKILRNKFNQEGKDLHTENYKTLWKKLKKIQINEKTSCVHG